MVALGMSARKLPQIDLRCDVDYSCSEFSIETLIATGKVV